MVDRIKITTKPNVIYTNTAISAVLYVREIMFKTTRPRLQPLTGTKVKKWLKECN